MHDGAPGGRARIRARSAIPGDGVGGALFLMDRSGAGSRHRTLNFRQGECNVARRPNYNFEKRQKELKRQEKQADKAERKRLRREEEAGLEGADGTSAQGDGDMGGDAGSDDVEEDEAGGFRERADDA